jgi:hypothetical protein
MAPTSRLDGTNLSRTLTSIRLDIATLRLETSSQLEHSGMWPGLAAVLMPSMHAVTMRDFRHFGIGIRPSRRSTRIQNDV